jgi:cobalt-zinc-cadmium efflux system protein
MMAGSNDHDHGVQAHDHGAALAADPSNRSRLTWVLAITITVLVVEVVGAVIADSLALLADAGHMLTDVAGLTLAVVAARLALRPTTDQRTWGYRRAEVLAAAAQAAVLLAVGGYILVEGVRRWFTEPEVTASVMIVFGVVGLAGNIVAMVILSGSRSDNMNMRAAFLEVVNDALGSVAVLVAAAVIALTGWERADVVASMLIGVLIIPRTWRLLREAVDVLLESTPKDLDLTVVREHVLAVRHVQAIHDLHASQVATGLPTFSAHVVVDDDCFHDGHLTTMLDEIQGCLAGHFDVVHSTIQFEAVSHAEHEPSRHD